MPYTDILYSIDDVVATITLNRPDKLNAWTSEMDADVHHAVERAAADDAVRAIVSPVPGVASVPAPTCRV